MSPSSTTHRGARRLLGRVLVGPVVILLAVGGYLVTARALAVRDVGTSTTGTVPPAVQQPWTDAYSRRFPGCVPAVLWPGRRTPVAVIVQWDGRTVARVERRLALRRAHLEHREEGGRVIGACYR